MEGDDVVGVAMLESALHHSEEGLFLGFPVDYQLGLEEPVTAVFTEKKKFSNSYFSFLNYFGLTLP